MNIITLFLIGAFTVPNPLKQMQDLQKKYHNVQYYYQGMEHRNPWTWVFTGPEGGEITSVLSHPGANNLAFALSFNDVWRTTDGGSTWDLSFENCMPQAGMMSAPATAVIVDGDGVVWITLDGGSTWAQTLTTTDYQTASFDVIDTVVYLVDSTPPRVWRSTNAGLTWQNMGTISSLLNAVAITHIPGSPSTYWLVGHTIPGDSLSYIYFSAMAAVVDTIYASEVMDFEEDPWNIWHTMITTDQGIYQATAGAGPWSVMAEPFLFGLYQAVDIEFTGYDTLVASSLLQQGIFTGRRTFGIWTFNRVFDNEVGTYMSFGGSSTLYCGTLGRGVCKSTNKGNSWTLQNNGLCAHVLLGVGAASEIPDSTEYFVGFGGTPYRTSNWGATWDTLSRNFLAYGTALEVAPANPNFLIGAALDIQVVGATLRLLTIFRSLNSGASWTEVDSIYSPIDLHIASNPNIVLAVVDTFIIRSTGAGNNFAPAFARSVRLSNLAGADTVFIATSESTFVSYDQGATWQGLTGRGGSSLAYDQTRKQLYMLGNYPTYRYSLTTSTLDSLPYGAFTASVAPNGNLYFLHLVPPDSIFVARSFDGGTTIEQELFPIAVAMPGGLRAANNGVFYYEPFRGFWSSIDITQPVYESNSDPSIKNIFRAPSMTKKGTRGTIHFTTGNGQSLKIQLYDIAGRRTQTIFQGRINKGANAISYSTQGLASGVYFVVLSGAETKVVRKIIIY